MTTAKAASGVLLTGATSGLGRAVALRFAAAGADVALVGRSEADLERTAAEVTAHGVRAIPLRVDLALTSSLSDVVDRAIAELGVIGVLVNAAETDAPGPAEDATL